MKHVVSLSLVLFLSLGISGLALGQAETQEKAPAQAEAEKQPPAEAEKQPVAEPEKKPKISFSTTDYDFGKVFRGDKVTHTFEFKNIGEGPLKVSKVKSSCGCTGALLTKGEVAPGETGQVKVSFNSAQVHSGKAKKYVSVYSNDIENNKVDLSIYGEIMEEVTAKPRTLKFEAVPIGTTPKNTVEVRSQIEDRPLEITEVTCSNPSVQVTNWSKQPDGSYVIEAEVKKGASTGSTVGKIIVENNSKRMSKLEVPVTVKVVGDVEITPQSVFMWKAKASKEGKKGTVRKLIVNIHNPEISLQEVRTSHPFIKVETVQKEPRKYELIVTLAEDTPEDFEGHLEIVTNSKEDPVELVPITGNLAKMAKAGSSVAE